jgi:hypothetical protein
MKADGLRQTKGEQLKRLLAEKTREVDFFKGALQDARSRGSTPEQRGTLARGHLRPNPGSDVYARQSECGTDVLPGAGLVERDFTDR